ncbi:formate dehydrogenase accessory sulfurtransferase FdhD [Novosphingobium sp.]|uniref:formate dehydrogenase accessory sulfurtransferase FdhD n=1 Tax=Novosphingobium sp. TaxID=1874826 RepID=UPI002735E4C9|nr:formate dehydrogenase accessory sulfurtransferase FdhD [Novosphingobium sp.]MDP3908705.1 formate dehydrogenase accessory sulfurtransferase FdhD [Novosphingobium sp.]
MSEGAVAIPVRPSACTPASGAGQRTIPIEALNASASNGIACSVMMPRPVDLEDSVTGLSLSDSLTHASEIGAISSYQVVDGLEVVARLNLPHGRHEPIMEHARRRLGDSSCGICGIESVELALRPLPVLQTHSKVRPEHIRRGLAAMGGAKMLVSLTAAAHAAAFCCEEGALVALRGDAMPWVSAPAVEHVDGL